MTSAACCLIDADDVADVLVLVRSGVDGLGDVVGHGGIVEVRVDVVVDTAGHALEEVGHVLVPPGLPGPGSVVEHVHWEDLEEHVLHTHRIREQLETSTFATHQRKSRLMFEIILRSQQ